MKKNSGFEDNVFYTKWRDQQYSTIFHVLISNEYSIQPCFKLLNKYKGYEYDENSYAKACCIENTQDASGQEIYLLFQTDLKPNTISHEAIHAKNYVFEYHGVKLDTINDEHEAYYMGYIVDNIITSYLNRDEELKKKKRKNAKKA